MKKQTILGVLLLFVMFCFNAKAEVITVEGANEIANTFFSQSARSQKSQLKSTTQLEYAWDSNSLTQSGNTMLKSTEEDPTFYVFNNPDGEGFVIVSGDDNARQVIGYSYESNAPVADEIPDPMKNYLLGIDKEIKWARANLTSDNKNLKATEAETGGSVVKLIETATWGQNDPFNRQCVTNSGERAATGCIATAFAIVMKHHAWPDEGIGSLPNCQTGDLISDRTYNWDKMLMSYSGTYTDEQANEVAKVMSHIGHAYMVTYGTGSTGGNTGNSTDKMAKFFAYKDVTATYGSSTDQAAWIELIKESIQNDCPIPYESTNSGSGDQKHIFVLDGYTDNDYFHFNWGWYGSQNGYFTLSAMLPGGGDDYSGLSNHKAFFNFKPNKSVTISVAVDPATSGSVTIDEASVTSKEVGYGTSVTLQATGDNFYGWLVDGSVVSTDATYTITANENITYTAKFVTDDNSVTIFHDYYEQDDNDIKENCSISGLKENGSSYPLDVELTVTANCKRSYKFNQWYTLDANGESTIPLSTDNPYKFTTNPDFYSIYYSFSKLSPIQPVVKSSDDNIGSVSWELAETPEDNNYTIVYPGEKIKLMAEPEDGYMCKGWSDGTGIISNQIECTVILEEGKTYTANFELAENEYNLIPTEGTFDALDGSVSKFYKYTHTETGLTLESTVSGTEENCISKPSDFKFAVGSAATTYTITAPANYKIVSYSFNYKSSANGRDINITVGETTTTSDYSTSKTVNETVNSESTTFTLSGSQAYAITITDFKVKLVYSGGDSGTITPTQYTATAVASPATGGTATVAVGTGQVAESQTVDAGTTVTFYAIPAEGYEFVNWTNGTSVVSGDNPFNAPINSNITLTANFRQTEQGGGDVELEYCEPSQNMVNKNGDRIPNRKLNSFTISDGETECTVSDIQTSYTDKVYKNRTESVLTTEGGANLSFTALNLDNTAWMHAYVYIDYNQDGTFNTDKNNNGTVKNGKDYGELVSYSAYSAISDDSGFTNINGAAASSSAKSGDGGNGVSTETIPAWTIPTDLAEGEYRLRFKIDWNSLDPCGNTTDNNAIEKNNGSICDITLKIIKKYTATVATSPTEGGTATVNNEQSVKVTSGTEVVYNTIANTGYNFLGWYKGDEFVTKDKLYYATITSDLTLTAKFEKQQVEISVTAGENGSVSVAQGTNSLTSPTTVEYGTEVTFTATANPGYRFDSWSDGSTDNPYTVTITEPKSITAYFEALQTFTVNVTTNGTGGTASATSATVYENGTVTLTAKANDGYRFTGWYQNGELVTMANPYTIQSVTGNINYVANFEEVSIEEIYAGICKPSYSRPVASDNDNNTYISAANVNGVSITLPEVTKNATNQGAIQVGYTDKIEVFAGREFMLNLTFAINWGDVRIFQIEKGNTETPVKTYGPYEGSWPNGNPLVEMVNTGITVDGFNVSFPITFSEDLAVGELAIIRLTIDTEDPCASVQYGGYVDFLFVMADPDRTVTVKSSDIVKGVVYITSPAPEGTGTGGTGTGTSSQSPSVTTDEDVTVFAEANDGYRFVNWTIGSNVVGTETTYTYTGATDVTITANFEKKPEIFTVSATVNDRAMGKATKSVAESSVEEGTSVTFTATAYTGYEFVNWTIDGTQVSTSATYTRTIDANTVLTANFQASTSLGGRWFRIKDNGTGYYLNAGNYEAHTGGAVGGVNVIALNSSSEDQIFLFEKSGSSYKLKTKSGYNIVCQDWNVDALTSAGTALTFEDNGNGTYTIKNGSYYFKVEMPSNYTEFYPYCNGGANTNDSSKKGVWVLEEVFISDISVTRTSATEGATIQVTTDAPTTITIGTQTYNTTAGNLTVEIPISATSSQEVTMEAVGGKVTSIECSDNVAPTEIPLSVTELTLRNVNASEVAIEAPLLKKITVVSDAENNAAIVSPASDLSQGVQVVVEKEIKTPQPVEGNGTPTIFNFLSMPFSFNTADIKYWDGDSWETAEPENHVRILLYDSQIRANHDYDNTWRTLQATESETIAANQGFVIVGNNDLGTTVKLQFTSAVAAYDGTVTSVTANRYRKEEGETNSKDGDWNFNGVPYLTAGEFVGEYTLYTYDNSTLSYVSHTPAEGLTLKPYQAVMYQAEIEGANLTKDIAINTASISNANATDDVYARAYISIDDATPAKIILSEETSENFVVNEDAWYIPSLINTTPAAYFNIEGADASVSVQPSANELPMTVYTGAGTAHRISLAATDGNYNVYLKDAATNETVCLNDEDYTFTATAKTTIANRFTISMLEPTGITESAADVTLKAVVLDNTIKIYGTEQGEEIALYTANGMIITNAVAEEGVTTIETTATGVIIIKVAEETLKVVK